MGVAAADFDNDGWPDLFVTGVRENILYHNRGDGTFEGHGRGFWRPATRCRRLGGKANGSAAIRSWHTTSIRHHPQRRAHLLEARQPAGERFQQAIARGGIGWCCSMYGFRAHKWAT
jgi:FG-GAP-like repeat